FADPVFTCLDCRACETACPADVQVGGLIEEARGQIQQAMPLTGFKGFISNTMLKGVFPHPSRLNRLGGFMRFYQKSGLQAVTRKLGLLNVLPTNLKDMEQIL